jgi:hypothetical protein
MTSTFKTTLTLSLCAAAWAGAAFYAALATDAGRSQASTSSAQAENIANPSEVQSARILTDTKGLVPLRPAAETPVIERAEKIALIKTPSRAANEGLASALRRANISVARLHEGRFLPAPHHEARAWTSLKMGSAEFTPLPASTHFDVLPMIAQNGVDSDNKIDEIRLAAIDANSDYVLIYATGKGAFWGQFGGKPLEQTGLTVSPASPARENGDAKAVLVQAHNGGRHHMGTGYANANGGSQIHD